MIGLTRVLVLVVVIVELAMINRERGEARTPHFDVTILIMILKICQFEK
jgi:hypothetical protein